MNLSRPVFTVCHRSTGSLSLGAKMKTAVLPTLLLLHLLLLYPLLCHARQHLTCCDLLDLLNFFTGEFFNGEQPIQDNVISKFSEKHMVIQRLHVPVRVPALDRVKGAEPCGLTQQVYEEQRFALTPTIVFQRILNFWLRKDQIFMETHQDSHQIVNMNWTHWSTDPGQFERLEPEDLQYRRRCTMKWTRLNGHFRVRADLKRCTFGGQVYLHSEINLNSTTLTERVQSIFVANGSIAAGSTSPYVYGKVTNSSDTPPIPGLGNACHEDLCSRPPSKKSQRKKNPQFRLLNGPSQTSSQKLYQPQPKLNVLFLECSQKS